MTLDKDSLEQALAALGEVLLERGLNYEIIVVGGSGLLLLGTSVRPTKDLDVLAVVERGGLSIADPLPTPLITAAKDVGNTFGLAGDWLNPGPTSLLELGFPEGFEDRLTARRFGGLVVQIAGRVDQIFFKLYATADMGPGSKHLEDLIRLTPTESELLDAAHWMSTHDPSVGFRQMIVRALSHLGVDDADAKLG